MLLSTNLRIAAATAILTFSSIANADLVPDGVTFVPVDVTLDGQSAFADTTFVILGCNSPGDGGKHMVGIVTANQPIRCSIKHQPTVYAIATKDVKPLSDLIAKNEGWGQEGLDAKKLVEGKTTCGTLDEKTAVDKTKNITFFTSRYALTKTPTGCSMKKIGDSIAQTTPLPATASWGSPNGVASAGPALSGDPATDAAPSTSDSATPPSGSGSASPSPSSSSSPPKGGGCGSCAVGSSRESGSGSGSAAIAALAIAASLMIRRKRQ